MGSFALGHRRHFDGVKHVAPTVPVAVIEATRDVIAVVRRPAKLTHRIRRLIAIFDVRAAWYLRGYRRW